MKKSFVFFFLIFLTNCTISGSAFLGPTFTGIKTGSIYQTSLSYGSSKIIEDINYAGGNYWGKEDSFKFLSKIDSFDIESVAEQGEDRVSKSTFTFSLFFTADKNISEDDSFIPCSIVILKLTSSLKSINISPVSGSASRS